MGHPANTATEHLLDIRGTVHKVSGKSEGKTCTPAAESACFAQFDSVDVARRRNSPLLGRSYREKWGTRHDTERTA
jgi:hypothetical protein